MTLKSKPLTPNSVELSRKLPLLAMAMAAVTPTFADTANPQSGGGAALEEVIVTSTRQLLNLQDVPISVSALTGDALADKGILNTADLAGSVPNLQINSPWGTTQPNFNLRGVGVANEFNANVASPIGVYFDEVYEGFRAAQGVQLFDIERLEVVKGPQGTLYGRNTTGGAINIVSRQPGLSSDSNGYLTAGYGNYNRKRFQAASDLTLIEDKLGVRVAVDWLKGDGYIKNKNADYGINNTLIGNKDFASEDSASGRLIIRGKPADTLDISLKLYSGRSDPIGAAPIPVFPFFGGSAIDGFNRNNLKNDEAVSYRGGKFTNTAKGAALTIDWEISDEIDLVSITGFSDNKQDLNVDFAGSILDVGNTEYKAHAKEFNQDVHLGFEMDRWHGILGAFYGQDKIVSNNRVTFFGFFDSLVPPGTFNPGGQFFTGPSAPPPTSVHVLQDFTQERESYALYAEGTYDLTDDWAITLGARYTSDKNTLDDFSALYLDSSGNPGMYTYASTPSPAGAPLVPGGYLPKLSSSDHRATGRAIVNYKFSTDVMGYLSYSLGYRAGAYNGLALSGPQQIYLSEPETLKAIEAGIKSRFLDDRVQVNAAVFNYDYRNQQIEEAKDGVTFLRNLNSRVLGAELEAEAQVTEALKLTTSIGYLHSRYGSGQVLSGIDVGGNQLPFAPEWTADIGGEYHVFNVGSGEVTISADAQYKSHQWFDPFNSEQAVGPINEGQSEYWIENARVSYNQEPFSVALYVKNIENKYYNAYGINTEGFAFNDYFIRGEPRTYGVELNVKF